MFSCRIKKKDDAIWFKHLPYDITEYCLLFDKDQEFLIYINNEEMYFIRMLDGKDGRPTPGIKATFDNKERWNKIERGSIISIGIPD